MHRALIFSCLLLSALLVVPVSADSGTAENYWQIVFQYDANGLTIRQVTPIAESRKAITTPGLIGAPVRLSYEADWLDASGAILAHSHLIMPLGRRVAIEDSAACEVVMPASDVVVVRVKGPSADLDPAQLRLTVAAAPMIRAEGIEVPSSFEFQSVTLPMQVAQQRPVQGPISVTKIRDTGPDNNRLVIVILGDGYTPASVSSGIYASHVGTLVSAFNATVPWNVMFNGTNIYRIDVESNENGADHDPYGTFRDTYFNSSFWVAGIERLLAVDDPGYYRAITAADALVGPGMWDELVIQVNSSKYGGSGGAVSVVSAHSAGPQVVLHELGHTFAGLADEYTSAYPGFPPGDGEPNVDYDASGPNLKWLVWVEPGTPLPTPATSQYFNSVGTFEGARYLTSGIYRPWYNCLMRSLGVPLDPVCREAHLKGFFNRTSLIDAATPAIGSNRLIRWSDNLFSVDPIPFAGLTYQWKINDSILAETTEALSLDWRQLEQFGTLQGDNLTLTVSYPTSMMRLSEESEQFSWTIRPDCNNNNLADATDLSMLISSDADHNGIPDECDALVCCEGSRGNVNGIGGLDLSDLSLLIAYLTTTPQPSLGCGSEANVNGASSIDLSDLSLLISYLTVTPKPVLPDCP